MFSLYITSTLLLVILGFFAGNGKCEDFQYKHVILGVVIAPETIPMSIIQSDQLDMKDLVYKTINNPLLTTLANAYTTTESSYSATFGPNGESGNNVTRIGNITIIQLDIADEYMQRIVDISILFTLAGCAETHELNHRVTKAFGPIVHIALTEPGCIRLDKSTAIMIPLTWYQFNSDLLQIFTDIRADKTLPKWKEAVVIYDRQSQEGIMDTFVQSFGTRDHLPDIALTLFTIDSLSNVASLVELHANITDFSSHIDEYFSSDQIEGVLAKYRVSEPTNFIVVTEFAKINFVLVTAKRVNMLNVMKQWLFVSADSKEDEDKWDFVTESILTDGVNIAFITNSSKNFTDRNDHLYCHTEAVLSLLAEVVEGLATWEFNLFLQVSDEEWDIIKPSRVDRVMNITETMKERLSTYVLATCDKNSSTWNLEAGENGVKGKTIFEVGWWNPVTGLRMTDDLFPHVTGGFRGRRILVTSMHFPPWQIITRPTPEDNENVTYSGLMFEVLVHMSKNLNFTFSVLEPPLGEAWGTVQSDGRWNGMMRLIIENPNIVLGAAAFTVTPERAIFVNYTEVLEREAYAFMVNRPSELSRILLFAEPFRYEVWLCIIVTVILLAPIFNIIHCMSYYYKFYKKVNDRGLFKLENCYWYIYGALLQQGGTQLPEAISGRLLIGFWWLFVMVSVTTYSGSLVAFLTFPKVENPVNSIDDVLSHRGVNSWGFMAGSVIEDHLKRSNNPQMEKLYKQAHIHPTFNESVFDVVKYHDHAYIDWKITLMTAMRDAFRRTGTCDYILGEETIFEEKIALAVPRGSPYLPLFNEEIKQMLQTGLVKKWKSRYWPQKDRCSSTIIAGSDNRTVKLGDMQGSFYILFSGFFVAVVVLAVEHFIYRRRKKRMINSIQIIVGSDKHTKFWQQKRFPFTQ